MKFIKLILVLSLFGAFSIASANTPSLSYVEVNYSKFDDDDLGFGELSLDGYQINVSFTLSDSIYLPITYASSSDELSFNDTFSNDTLVQNFSSTDKYTLKDTQLGLGHTFLKSDSSFAHIEAGYYAVEVNLKNNSLFESTIDGTTTVESNSFSDSDTLDGFYAELGYQTLFDNNLQANAAIFYRRVSSDGVSVDETSLLLELLYNFSEDFALKSGFESADTRFTLGLRYNF